METIILVGGPFDGKTLPWNGGDVVQLSKGPPSIDFSVPTTEPLRFDDVFYRRSLASPSKFVFQP